MNKSKVGQCANKVDVCSVNSDFKSHSISASTTNTNKIIIKTLLFKEYLA